MIRRLPLVTHDEKSLSAAIHPFIEKRSDVERRISIRYRSEGTTSRAIKGLARRKWTCKDLATTFFSSFGALRFEVQPVRVVLSAVLLDGIQSMDK